jgi:hypothetical protein
MGCGAQHPVIFVKIGWMYHKVKEYCITSGITYSDLFKKAEIGSLTDNDEIVLNGTTRAKGILSNFAQNGDVILITRKPSVLRQIVQITVKVSRVGQRIFPIVVPERSTVHQCLVSAGMLPFADEDIWLHENDTSKGYRVTMDQVMWNGYTLILEKRKVLTLYDKVRSILVDVDMNDFESEDEQYDQAAKEVCAMLYQQYNGIK